MLTRSSCAHGLEIIAEHRIRTTLYIVFLSLLVNIHDCSLLFLSFTLCLFRKNGKHMSVPRISPAFFGSQVTATVIMSHYLLRPVTAGRNLGLFFPYACLSHLIVPSANQLLIYIYINASCFHSSLEAHLPLRALLFSDQLDL